jgi:hypothetical protein
MARTFVCPHCFRRIGHSEVSFVCVTGRACEGDSALGAADPRARSATCGTCGRVTTRRVCGRCHDRLPEGYLEAPGKMVALAGPAHSGKSTYIAVIVHELLQRLGGELQAALVPCDDETMTEYRERYERSLYDDNAVVPKTVDTRDSRPLVYQLSRSRRGAFGTSRDTVLTLVFLDTAGERFTSQERIETELRYLAEADAVLVLVDPHDLAGTQKPAAAATAEAGGRLRTAEATAPSTDVLNRVLQHLKGVHGVQGNKKLKLPVAVAVTKLDLLWPQLGANSPLHRSRAPGAVYDAEDRATVHTEVQALLSGWQEQQVELRLRQSCSDYQLFAMSMLGAAPRGDNLGLGGVRPHRVEDPLMWLLHRFGMLDRGKV